MKNSDITDPLFRQAVTCIDSGDLQVLQQLLNKHPELVSKPLDLADEGYFSHPYLLWFVADNPVRNGKLPANITGITKFIIQMARQYARDSFQNQLDYTLGLVATGSSPRNSGVQIALIDLLIDEGAKPGSGHGALAHGNIGAAARLIERGGILTLTTAVGLERKEDVLALLKTASQEEKQIALMAAAFYGKAATIQLLIASGVDVNAYINPSSDFHSHASPLHQAVYSGSLEAVKMLVDAGADLNETDRVYHGTPLGWAISLQTETNNEEMTKKYAAIESYLQHA